MKQINVGIIGTGWCGGIRAETCAANPLVKDLHVAETRPERLAEIAAEDECRVRPRPTTASCSRSTDIDAMMISATPETTHYPMARDCLARRQARVPREADRDRAARSRRADRDSRAATRLKFTIGYSQRFNPKFAYVKQCDRRRHHRPAGQRAREPPHHARPRQEDHRPHASSRPPRWKSTHDLDFVLWCLEPAKPVRVYSQVNYGAMREATGADVPDNQWITVTMDNGLSFVVGGGWSLPPGLSEFLDDVDRDDRHRRRGDRRRQPSGRRR